MQMRRSQMGFTLIELITTMAIAGILLGVGIPSFLTAVQNNRLSADYREFASALHFARSEAIKRGQNVWVCARRSDDRCATNRNRWSNGWLVFVEPDTSFSYNATRTDEELLRVVDERSEDSNIILRSPNSSGNGNNKRAFIVYLPSGESNRQGATAEFCDSRGKEYAKALNVNITGSIRKAHPNGNDTVPIDYRGRPITCA